MSKFKIKESKENSTYTVKTKKAWYLPWRIAKKKNGEFAIFAKKASAAMFMSHQQRLELKESKS
jgi:hypothetical protein